MHLWTKRPEPRCLSVTLDHFIPSHKITTELPEQELFYFYLFIPDRMKVPPYYAYDNDGLHKLYFVFEIWHY